MIVANGAKVYTLGDYSNTLLIAYGKDHVIDHNGELKVTGKEGIAINIDFGDNSLGNTEEYRVALICIKFKDNIDFSTELEVGAKF